MLLVIYCSFITTQTTRCYNDKINSQPKRAKQHLLPKRHYLKINVLVKTMSGSGTTCALEYALYALFRPHRYSIIPQEDIHHSIFLKKTTHCALSTFSGLGKVCSCTAVGCKYVGKESYKFRPVLWGCLKSLRVV